MEPPAAGMGNRVVIGLLWTTCQDNGVVVLKFRKGVWPFEESSTPPGQQN